MHDWAIQQLRWSQLVRAAGQRFIITPLSALAAGSQPEREQAGASAIFNIMRNLGGSIGIALLSTFITFREQYHFSIIGDRLTQNSSASPRKLPLSPRRSGPRRPRELRPRACRRSPNWPARCVARPLSWRIPTVFSSSASRGRSASSPFPDETAARCKPRRRRVNGGFRSSGTFTFLKGAGPIMQESVPDGDSDMFTNLIKLLKNEDGATAIEYGLIAALIAVAAVTVMGTVGTNLSTTFNTVAGKL
jgi:Flp pilus assembly pilin Flp